MAVTLPVILFSINLILEKKKLKETIFIIIPYFIIFIVYWYIRYYVLGGLGGYNSDKRDFINSISLILNNFLIISPKWLLLPFKNGNYTEAYQKLILVILTFSFFIFIVTNNKFIIRVILFYFCSAITTLIPVLTLLQMVSDSYYSTRYFYLSYTFTASFIAILLYPKFVKETILNIFKKFYKKETFFLNYLIRFISYSLLIFYLSGLVIYNLRQQQIWIDFSKIFYRVPIAIKESCKTLPNNSKCFIIPDGKGKDILTNLFFWKSIEYLPLSEMLCLQKNISFEILNSSTFEEGIEVIIKNPLYNVIYKWDWEQNIFSDITEDFDKLISLSLNSKIDKIVDNYSFGNGQKFIQWVNWGNLKWSLKDNGIEIQFPGFIAFQAPIEKDIDRIEISLLVLSEKPLAIPIYFYWDTQESPNFDDIRKIPFLITEKKVFKDVVIDKVKHIRFNQLNSPLKTIGLSSDFTVKILLHSIKFIKTKNIKKDFRLH